jgi:hypothetical protein
MTQTDPSLFQLAKAVVDILQQYGSAKPKEIRKYLNQSGNWRNPPINLINKVLAQYLGDQVNLVEGGSWTLIQPNSAPATIVQIEPVPNKEKRMREKRSKKQGFISTNNS